RNHAVPSSRDGESHIHFKPAFKRSGRIHYAAIVHPSASLQPFRLDSETVNYGTARILKVIEQSSAIANFTEVARGHAMKEPHLVSSTARRDIETPFIGRLGIGANSFICCRDQT